MSSQDFKLGKFRLAFATVCLQLAFVLVFHMLIRAVSVCANHVRKVTSPKHCVVIITQKRSLKVRNVSTLEAYSDLYRSTPCATELIMQRMHSSMK